MTKTCNVNPAGNFAIGRQIAPQHGAITAISESGKGSDFTLQLPAQRDYLVIHLTLIGEIRPMSLAY